jgi:hypothetical protein
MTEPDPKSRFGEDQLIAMPSGTAVGLFAGDLRDLRLRRMFQYADH